MFGQDKLPLKRESWAAKQSIIYLLNKQGQIDWRQGQVIMQAAFRLKYKQNLWRDKNDPIIIYCWTLTAMPIKNNDVKTIRTRIVGQITEDYSRPCTTKYLP